MRQHQTFSKRKFFALQRCVLSMPVESSREECGNTKHSRKENPLLSKISSSSDDEYVFSTSQPYVSSQDSSSSVAAAAAAAAAATICNVKKGGNRSVLSMPVESSREECDNTKHSQKENSLLFKDVFFLCLWKAAEKNAATPNILERKILCSPKYRHRLMTNTCFQPVSPMSHLRIAVVP